MAIATDATARTPTTETLRLEEDHNHKYAKSLAHFCREMLPVVLKPTLKIDDYILDVLMPDLIGHDRQPSAFILYLRLWRLTDGGRKKSAPLSLRDLAEQTGLSKRAIQDAVDRLERRQLVTVERAMPTTVPTYRVCKPWLRA